MMLSYDLLVHHPLVSEWCNFLNSFNFELFGTAVANTEIKGILNNVLSLTFKKNTSCLLENYSPASMVTEVLRILCDQKECAVECLCNNTVMEALLQPVHNLMKGTKVGIKESLDLVLMNKCSMGFYF